MKAFEPGLMSYNRQRIILLLVWNVCAGNHPRVRPLVIILLVNRVILSLDRERGHVQPLPELMHTALLKGEKRSWNYSVASSPGLPATSGLIVCSVSILQVITNWRWG